MSACDSKSAAVDRCLAELLERRSAIEGLIFNDQVDEASKIVARHSLELNRSRCSTLFAQLCVRSEGLHLDKDYPLAMAKGTLMEARLLATAPKQRRLAGGVCAGDFVPHRSRGWVPCPLRPRTLHGGGQHRCEGP